MLTDENIGRNSNKILGFLSKKTGGMALHLIGETEEGNNREQGRLG